MAECCEAAPAVSAKVACPTCGRRVKAAGLADHERDAHGPPRPIPPVKANIHIEKAPLARSVEQREAVCGSKIRYRKRGAAKQAAREILERMGRTTPMSIYPCEFCRGWHVGKSTKTILARLRVVDVHGVGVHSTKEKQ